MSSTTSCEVISSRVSCLLRQTFLLLLLTNISQPQLLEVVCPFTSITNCTCNEIEDIIDADCPHFSLRLQPGEAVAIRCSDDALELPNLNFNDAEPIVRITNCPLPNNSYGDLFRSDDELVSNCSVMLSIRHLKSPENISAEHFIGLTELTRLDLAFNNLTLLPDNLLENITSITWLDLNNNFLSVLSPSFFENSALLERLYLNNNELYDLSEMIFMNLSSLLYLNLRKNYINHVNSSTFIGLNNLRYLDLSQNQIQRVKSGTFQHLKLLKFIDLSENYFKRFFSTVFYGLKQLSHIRIDGNMKVFNMTEESEWIPGHEKELELSNYLLSNLPQLQYISVSNSGLDVLPRFLVMKSKGLLQLHFRSNALTTIPRFMLQDCTQLKVLDVGENAIDDLPRDLFSELEALRHLRLDHNKLSKLPHSYTVYGELEELLLHNNTFEWMPNWVMRQLRDSSNLRVVTLAENPWRCDCRLRDLAVFLRSRKSHVVLDKQNVMCVDGRRVMDLTDENLCGFTYVN